MFNMAGKVVGITTSHLVGGENLNFAIPINDVKPLLLSRLSKTHALPDEPEPVTAEQTTHAQPNAPTTEEIQKILDDKMVEYRTANPTYHITTNDEVHPGSVYHMNIIYCNDGRFVDRTWEIDSMACRWGQCVGYETSDNAKVAAKTLADEIGQRECK